MRRKPVATSSESSKPLLIRRPHKLNPPNLQPMSNYGQRQPRSHQSNNVYSAAEKQPFVHQASSNRESENEGADDPQYDRSSSTRTWCIVAPSFGAAAALACLIYGGIILKNNPDSLCVSFRNTDTVGPEIAALAVNIALTLCTDGMMFVHAVSLRWALYNEDRLKFNTNVRLLTSSKKLGPNRWYINLLLLSCLVLTYGASLVLLLNNELEQSYSSFNGGPWELNYQSRSAPLMINGTAVVALGIGLAGQAAVSLWCLLSRRQQILTWSSNPLNTTLAAIQHGNIVHQPGRSMLSVHHRHQWSNQQVYPTRPSCMFRTRRIVRFIVVLFWALAFIAIARFIIIAVIARSFAKDSAGDSSCWRFGFEWNPNARYCTWNLVTLSLSPSANNHNPSSAAFSYPVEAVLCILFICLVQATQTFALHCAELIVNLSRDESVWRHAYREGKKEARGACLSMNPFMAAVTSWENAVLFIAKALLHWSIGQGLHAAIGMEDTGDYDVDASIRYGFQFEMIYSRLIVFAILTFLLAAFTTFLAFRVPRGYQPTTLGHLPTLADLVDDWQTDNKGRLWWGDKSLGILPSNGQVSHPTDLD